MRVRHQLDQLEPLILYPLRRLSQDGWHRAPARTWSIAQIVQHLSIGVDSVADAFERRADTTGMRRRATPYQTILRHLLLGVGRFPPGAEAPEGTQPAEHPDPELVVAQFRMGVAKLRLLVEDWPAERQAAVFVRHPVVGDLNLPEWVRFHYVHCRHHARQIRERMAWLNANVRREGTGAT